MFLKEELGKAYPSRIGVKEEDGGVEGVGGRRACRCRGFGNVTPIPAGADEPDNNQIGLLFTTRF